MQTPIQRFSAFNPDPNATPLDKKLDEIWERRRDTQVRTAIDMPSYVAAEKHFRDFLRGDLSQLTREDADGTLICGSYMLPKDPSDALCNKVITRLGAEGRAALPRVGLKAVKWGERITGMLIYNDGYRKPLSPGGFMLDGDEHGGLMSIAKVYTFYIFALPA